MNKQSEKIKKYRKQRKEIILKSMGGKCQCCGYNNCAAALELHHIDPNEKEVSFSNITSNPKKWDIVVNELRKCILLCAICHREIHANVRTLPETYQQFDESFVDYKSVKTQHIPQPIIKYDWNKFDLTDLYINQNLSTADIADQIGCSSAAVYKQLIKQGIDIRKNATRPPKGDLESLIWEMPMTHIAKLYNVTETSVRKWVNYYDIEKPPRTYWQKNGTSGKTRTSDGISPTD